MIDYFALALGHALMAIALLRLVLRDDLDADPLLEGMKSEQERNRLAAIEARRSAARRALGKDRDAQGTADIGDTHPG